MQKTRINLTDYLKVNESIPSSYLVEYNDGRKIITIKNCYLNEYTDPEIKDSNLSTYTAVCGYNIITNNKECVPIFSSFLIAPIELLKEK